MRHKDIIKEMGFKTLKEFMKSVGKNYGSYSKSPTKDKFFIDAMLEYKGIDSKKLYKLIKLEESLKQL